MIHTDDHMLRLISKNFLAISATDSKAYRQRIRYEGLYLLFRFNCFPLFSIIMFLASD